MRRGARPCHTCVLLYSGEGLLEGVGGGGALSGVGRQAVGVHGLHGGVSVGLMRDAGEAVDDGRDDAGHSGGGYIGRWRTEAWREGKSKKKKKTNGSVLTGSQNTLSIETKTMQRYTDSNAPICKRVNTNSTGTHVHARRVSALMQEPGSNVSLSHIPSFFSFPFCVTLPAGELRRQPVKNEPVHSVCAVPCWLPLLKMMKPLCNF